MENALLTAGPAILGIPVVFPLFVAILLGVALWHERALEIAVGGLALLLVVRIGFSSFDPASFVAHEWGKLANLFGLLVGFALLADHFERSHMTELLARRLPGGVSGCFMLLGLVWLLSGVLDNIAAAIVGATVAAGLFERRVHIGYLAAIVAAANAGGAGSVIGDTTTTMMWVDGVSPVAVMPAYLGSAVALAIFGFFASRQQAKHAPRAARPAEPKPLDVARLGIVVVALLAAVGTNIVASSIGGAHGELPWLALALWVVLVAGALVRPPSWGLIPQAARGSFFLLALVSSAALMPVESLPAPSWKTALVLGLVSSIFDNIPLTKLALDQGGYDSALLAYAVGLGGSMVWFGSSAGVAVAGMFPEAKSVGRWFRHAWHVPLAFVIGFFALLGARGFHP